MAYCEIPLEAFAVQCKKGSLFFKAVPILFKKAFFKGSYPFKRPLFKGSYPFKRPFLRSSSFDFVFLKAFLREGALTIFPFKGFLKGKWGNGKGGKWE